MIGGIFGIIAEDVRSDEVTDDSVVRPVRPHHVSFLKLPRNAAYLEGRAVAGHCASGSTEQPICNENRSVYLILDGEIHNHAELRSNMVGKGYLFRTDSSAEVVLHLYEEEGIRCVERVLGVFAFAIWDAIRRQLHAARDRMGQRPLFFAQKNGVFAFASQIAWLLQENLASPVADREALSMFWHRTYVPAPWTAFKDIRRLLPGQQLTWDADSGAVCLRKYDRIASHPPFQGTYQDASRIVRSLVLQATRRTLTNGVSVGVALSGGIDSACVTAAARELSRDSLVTVTVRSTRSSGRQDEGKAALRTAKLHNTRHFDEWVEPNLQECFDPLTRAFGEPFAAGSAIACYYLYKALKRHATVVLSGDGGDEAFGGYRRYRIDRYTSRVHRLIPYWLRHVLVWGLENSYSRMPASRGVLKGPVTYLESIHRDQCARHAFGLATEVRSEWDRLLTGEGHFLMAPGPLLRFQADLERSCRETERVKQLMFLDQRDYLPNHGIVKANVCSRLHGVDLQSPLLDHRVVAFARRLPVGWLVTRKKGKRILRDAFSAGIDPIVDQLPKAGFPFPLREILRTSALEYIRDHLLSPSPFFFELFRRTELERALREHVSGKPFHTTLLLKLLCLRRWMELFHVEGFE